MKKGFTLAEVLITLGVIGVVAALTIPILINAYQEHEAVAKVKETYSLVSQATEQWANDIGCVGQLQKCMQSMDWQWGEVYPEEPRMDWTHNLKVVKKHTTRWQGTPDWVNYQNYRLDGTAPGYGASSGTYMGVSEYNEAHRVFHYLLPNGVILAVSSAVGDFMWMDINGNKPPNRVGKDQFPIGFSRGWNGKYGIIPYFTECSWIGSSAGVCSEQCPNPCNPDDGKSPTAYVLTHNKLPDLTALGYPANP